MQIVLTREEKLWLKPSSIIIKRALSFFFQLSGEGRASIDEVGTSRFTLMTSACWNGIAMGAVDIARRHVTTKEHADMGMRIADYPTIQVSGK